MTYIFLPQHVDVAIAVHELLKEYYACILYRVPGTVHHALASLFVDKGNDKLSNSVTLRGLFSWVHELVSL